MAERKKTTSDVDPCKAEGVLSTSGVGLDRELLAEKLAGPLAELMTKETGIRTSADDLREAFLNPAVRVDFPGISMVEEMLASVVVRVVRVVRVVVTSKELGGAPEIVVLRTAE